MTLNTKMTVCAVRILKLVYVPVRQMGIHGLSKVIGDFAPSSMKENDIKNYFG